MRIRGLVTYAKLGEKTHHKTGEVTPKYSVAVMDESIGRCFLTIVREPFPVEGDRVEVLVTNERAFIGTGEDREPGAVVFREGVVMEQAA